ncbi:MAG TPA: penicillin-binding protein 2 [Syntrophomonadaceae bacterium]|nr:penicillin-binding protein 2 [Syntrophomonadaceae bacterium]HQE22903.1 penicillin-binding protein 2 [Syntrophomonadaceae bacterium]
MKADELKRKLTIYSYIVIILMVALCLRLTIIQLFDNERYQAQAKENRIRLVSIKAPRGEIYANSGEILAANKLVYTLSLSFIENQIDEEVLDRLVEALQEYYPEITRADIEEKIEVQKHRLYEPITIIRDIPWELVVKLEENRQELAGVLITVEPLRYYPGGDLAGHLLGYIHSINEEELTQADGTYSINSLIGKSGIEKQYENVLRGKDGARRVEVDAAGRPIRELVTLEPEQGNNIYLSIDYELQQVLDSSMKKTLEELQKTYPKAKVGSAVVLNVRTGEVLAMTSMPALNPDDWKGNISNEKAAYYFPQGDSYDPMDPGAAMNRAIQVSYPPGSTFKPVTGMAALESGNMNPIDHSVNCAGRYWLAPYIKCTGVHGQRNYYSAMAVSCNTYFQEMGRRAGQNQIIHVAEQFGLGQKTGVDLPHEISGLLPTPQWKKELNALLIDRKYDRLRQDLEQRYDQLLKAATSEEERARIENRKKNEKAQLEAQYQIDYNFDTTWQPFDTYNMSIGQGYNDYTVMQLANYVATIANGGSLMEPHILKKVVSPSGKTIKEVKPKVRHRVDVNPSTLAETKRAMLAVTEPGGTAHFLFYHFPQEIKVGAKTGTAQTGRRGDDPLKEFHGVFIAFAPFDNPEIAFAGVVEYGFSGGGSAGLVCRDVFEHYFGIKDHLREAETGTQIEPGTNSHQVSVPETPVETENDIQNIEETPIEPTNVESLNDTTAETEVSNQIDEP